MLTEQTLRVCVGALAQSRDAARRELEIVVSLADNDLSNPVCAALLRRRDAIQQAYGEVVRALEKVSAARDGGEY